MQTPLRALIVDTEAPDRELLQDMLATHRNVRVVGEANSAPTALSLYETLHPNLLFMDVQMPKGDGFSLLPKLKPLPSVIFVTASDDFAVKAFEVDAVSTSNAFTAKSSDAVTKMTEGSGFSFGRSEKPSPFGICTSMKRRLGCRV